MQGQCKINLCVKYNKLYFRIEVVMNIYLQALGFSNMNSESEKRFINAGIKGCIEEGFVLSNNILQRGVVILRISKSTGLYIFGRYQNKEFIYEYYFPFVVGNTITENDELTVERHLDKESYAVVCDEMKSGVTIIFYLQNVMDYLEYVTHSKSFNKDRFNPDRKNDFSKIPLKNKKVALTALCLSGVVLLPMKKDIVDKDRVIEEEKRRLNLIAAAKKGDENAIESLTIDDIDTYTKISNRVQYEDVFTIVTSTFMPCGVECDQYSVVGEIMSLSVECNEFTKEDIYIMNLECNNITFTMAVSKNNVMGEPAVGRRFKGQIWLQGNVKF